MKQRFDINKIIEVTQKDTSFKSEGINISEDGVLLRVNRQITPNTTENYVFMFSLEMGDEVEDISCEGRVIHTFEAGEKSNIGIQFVGLDNRKSELLEKYCKLLEKKSVTP